MVSENAWFYWRDQALLIHIYVQPRAKENQLVGIHGECLKIRLTAPPVDEKANEALRKFIANYCKVSVSNVIITHGHQSRKKWVKIENPTDLSILNENRTSK